MEGTLYLNPLKQGVRKFLPSREANCQGTAKYWTLWIKAKQPILRNLYQNILIGTLLWQQLKTSHKFESIRLQLGNKDSMVHEDGTLYTANHLRNQMVAHVAINYESMYPLLQDHITVHLKRWCYDMLDPNTEGEFSCLVVLRELRRWKPITFLRQPLTSFLKYMHSSQNGSLANMKFSHFSLSLHKSFAILQKTLGHVVALRIVTIFVTWNGTFWLYRPRNSVCKKLIWKDLP